MMTTRSFLHWTVSLAVMALLAAPAMAKPHRHAPKPVPQVTPEPPSNWIPVTINGFFNPSPPRLTPDCAGRAGGEFTQTNDIGKLTNAQLNDDLSCVRFGYGADTIYVSEGSVDHSETARSRVKVCDPQFAAAQPQGSQEGITMGAGESHKCSR